MVADILLAECAGNGWLVRGEQYINDFLANTLPPHVSIEVVACESKFALDELRERSAGPNDTEPVMWMIHPAIMNRARGQIGGDLSIVFAEWSASLSQAGSDALQMAADFLATHPEQGVTLVRHLPDAAPAMQATMADLRSGLIEARLAELGVAAPRIARETRVVEKPGDADRIVLVVKGS